MWFIFCEIRLLNLFVSIPIVDKVAAIDIRIAKIKMIKMQIDIEPRHRGLQHAQPFRNNFFAYTITGDHRDIHSLFGHFVLSIHLLVNLGFRINTASDIADRSPEYRAAQHRLG